MAYSFQTFVSSQLFTATEANQIESNIKDHIHGESSVTGSYQAFYGKKLVVSSCLAIGGNFSDINFYTASANDLAILSAIANQSIVKKNQIIFSNVNSGSQHSLIFTTSSLTGSITYGVDFNVNGVNVFVPTNGLEIGFSSIVNSSYNYHPCFRSAYLSGNLKTLGYISVVSAMIINNNITGIVISDNINLGCDKTFVSSNNIKHAANNFYNVTIAKEKVYSIKRITNGTYDIVSPRYFPPRKQADVANVENSITVSNPSSYVVLSGIAVDFQSQSLTSASEVSGIQEGDCVEIFYNISGRATSGVKSDLHIGFSFSNGYGPFFSPLCLVSSRGTYSGGIVDLISTTVDSGDRFSGVGSCLIRCNSYPGPSLTYANLIITANSLTISSQVSSLDTFYAIIVN